MLADSFDDKVRSNSILAVGKRMVKMCTDKVKLTSVYRRPVFQKKLTAGLGSQIQGRR